MTELERFLSRAESLLQRVEQVLPSQPPAPDWDASVAFRWRKRGGLGFLQPVKHLHHIRLADLQGVEEQKNLIDRNTCQFVRGLSANNVLLAGARGVAVGAGARLAQRAFGMAVRA